jgi:hypothetical protein
MLTENVEETLHVSNYMAPANCCPAFSRNSNRVKSGVWLSKAVCSPIGEAHFVVAARKHRWMRSANK